MVTRRPAPRPSQTPSQARSVPIRQALGDSEPLIRLTQRVLDSQARLAALHAVLPASLASQVRSGPLDDETWTLLTANGAVAAKLRQMLPLLVQALAEQGWPARTIRVKVLARSGLGLAP